MDRNIVEIRKNISYYKYLIDENDEKKIYSFFNESSKIMMIFLNNYLWKYLTFVTFLSKLLYIESRHGKSLPSLSLTLIILLFTANCLECRGKYKLYNNLIIFLYKHYCRRFLF